MVTIKGHKILFNAGYETVKEFTEPDKVKKRSPWVSLKVAPFSMPFVPIELVSTDVGELIQSVSFAKSRSIPGASVQVVLAGDNRALRGVDWKITGPLKKMWNLVGPDLTDLFRPQTMVQLWIHGYSTCTGYVLDCRRKTTPEGAITYTVDIEELGNIYQQSITSFNTILWGTETHLIDDTSKLLSLGASQLGIPLAQSLKTYIWAFLVSSLLYGPRVFPPHFRLSDGLPLIYRMIALPSPIGCISNSSLISTVVTDSALFQTSAGGSFWDFLKTLCPEPFMELFTETGGRTVVSGRMIPVGGAAGSFAGLMAGTATTGINITPTLPGFNYVIARTAPYEIPWTGVSPWLPMIYPFTMGILDLLLGGDFVIITEDDVREKDLGVSGSGQYTVFNANYGGRSGSNGTTIKNRPSIARGPLNPLFSGGLRTFGHREYEAQISATSLSWNGIVGQTVEELWRRRGPAVNVPVLSSLLNVWFRNAGKFREGTIVTRAIPYARPGMALLYLPPITGTKVDNPRDLGIYYIDNVQYDYNIGKADLTTFSVIRGTPLPMSVGALASLLMDWEILPPGLGLWDGGF